MLAPENTIVNIPSSFDDAKAYLLQSNKNGNNLYDHLTDLVLKLFEQKTENAFDLFESISTEVKSSKLKNPEEPTHQVRQLVR